MLIKNFVSQKFIIIVLIVCCTLFLNKNTIHGLNNTEYLTYKKNYKLLMKNIQNQQSILNKLKKTDSVINQNKNDNSKYSKSNGYNGYNKSIELKNKIIKQEDIINDLKHKLDKLNKSHSSVKQIYVSETLNENKNVQSKQHNQSKQSKQSKQTKNIEQLFISDGPPISNGFLSNIINPTNPMNPTNPINTTDPVYIRDNQVLNDKLYPPLGRTERPQFDLLMNFINNQSGVFNMYTRGPPDTFRMLGYLTPKHGAQTIDSTLILYGRAKWQNSDLGDFYATSSSKISDIKIPLTQYNCNIRRIWDIPTEVEITGPMLGGKYDFTELPKPDLTHPYI